MKITRTLAALTLFAFLPACQWGQKGVQVAPGVALEHAMVFLQVQARSPDPAIRANCIEALEPSTDPRARQVIEQGLHDPEWVVRFAAAMATGKRKDSTYRSILENLAAKDPNDSVKVAAIYALRRLGSTANMNTLAATLRSPDPIVRANTALVLGLMGDPSAITLLRTVESETVQPVKFEITAALARLGDRQAQDVIIAWAFSKFAEDQYSAMMVCADLPERAASPLLVGLAPLPPNVPLEQKDVATFLTTRRQLVAARALGKRNTIQGIDVADENLKNSNPELRALAAMALAEMVHGTADRALYPMLKDPDPRVQRAAAQAIVNINSRSATMATN
jgi:HEAT repeat protein